MHEYAIAQALVEQVAAIAHRNGGHRVTRVTIQVGGLRGVVPDILRWGFEVAAAGSIAAGAALEIEEVPIVVRCRGCQARSELDAPLYLCPACGSADVEQIAGNELILKTLEIDNDSDSGGREYPARE